MQHPTPALAIGHSTHLHNSTPIDPYPTANNNKQRINLDLVPPKPPIVLSPLVAVCPQTDPSVLWHIAKNMPELRKWIIANPRADASLLEYLSQHGGPDIQRCLGILLDSYHYAHSANSA